MRELPIEFRNRMCRMLGDDYPAFLNTYHQKPHLGLRVNALKAESKEFAEKGIFHLEPIPFAENGYYYQEDERPGKHPLHEAGVYYIQEPSAMTPVSYLDVQRGERILDLCAAPGGKSTQIAVNLQGEGILFCNEIHPQRARILSENIERMGIRNAVVTNETPQNLESHFPQYFDKILVDAPCSGEGMFHRNEAACAEWSLQNVELCADRQDEILDCAASMLCPGGRMVYSTCTFAPQENEGSIYRFLTRHTDFELIEVQKKEGMASGRADWIALNEDEKHLERTIRVFPHLMDGEGHFIAVLKKKGESNQVQKAQALFGVEKGISLKKCVEFQEFCVNTFLHPFEDSFICFGEQVYRMPDEMPSIKGLKVLRPGLHMGTLKKKRFIPSHSLALALQRDEVYHSTEVTLAEAYQYQQGMTLNREGEKGWVLLTLEGYSIGWGKLVQGVLKNHYPKGLRK